MTETITYDGSEETTGELTAEEQDSLVVGEQMEQAQEQLLAGKYKSAEELEKAYGELEKKLGDREATPEPEDKPQIPELKEEEPQSSDFLDRLWEESQGEYTNDTLKELGEMNARDLAQMHLEYRSEAEKTKPQKLTEDTVSELKGIVGGDQGYKNMMGWAQQNLSEQEVGMYDAVMDRGDPLACFFAVQALAYRFNDVTGVEGEMLTGKAPSRQGDSFKSQAEVVRAMNDPRYDDDSAYRQEVMKKLGRSDI